MARGREREGKLGLKAARGFDAALRGVHQVGDVPAELVEAQTGADQQPPGQETQALLGVAGAVGDAGQGARLHAERNAALARVQADVDLVVVIVEARVEQGDDGAEAAGVGVLGGGALGEARVVLLDAVAMHGIVEKEGEVGEQVEQVAGEEAVGAQDVSIGEGLDVVGRARSEPDASAVAGVDVAVAVE